MTDKSKPEDNLPSEAPANEVSVVENTQTQSQPPAVVVQKSGKGLSVFAILLSLFAMAGTAFSLYVVLVLEPQKNLKEEGALAVGVTEIGGQVSRLGDTIQRIQIAQDDVVSQAVLDAKLSEVSNNTDLKVRSIQETQRQVSTLVDKLSDDLNKGTKDYTIAEVAQLLKLANHSVNFSKDPGAAINALNLADAQLKELADPRYAIVRQAINEEIASLESVTSVDLENITGRLRAIEKVIPDLPLENDTPVLGDIEVDKPDGDTDFKSQLKVIWADLVAEFKPQRIDQAPKPLLAPEQRYFLDQNIQLQLAKAQLSVLQSRAGEYTVSLESAENLLNSYYATRSDEVIKVLNNLEALKSTQLANDLPNVSKSYDLLQKARGGR